MTRIGLFASVDENMGAEMGDLDEASGAGVALVRFFARVDAQVGFQVCWSIKLGFANWTLVRFAA